MLNWAFFLYLEARSAPNLISSFAWTISWGIKAGKARVRGKAPKVRVRVFSAFVRGWFRVTFRVKEGFMFRIGMEVKRKRLRNADGPRGIG